VSSDEQDANKTDLPATQRAAIDSKVISNNLPAPDKQLESAGTAGT